MTNLGYTSGEPIAAVATPLVPCAIGIVRASGKNSAELFAEFFSRKNAILSAEGNSLVHGWIINPADGKKIDEVMVGVYKEPKSFTGEDMIEVFCHGGVGVVKAIISIFLQNGFRSAERGEFTFRAFVNGKTDLTRAEAVKEIIDSRTEFSRSRAAGRLDGNLFSRIEEIKKSVVEILASIQVEIEYPEDEENFADSFDSAPLVQVKKNLAELSASWSSEKIFQDGAKIVLCGKTNAGKSSLFNALLKEERAIVSGTEGTTRDWLESFADFGGIPVRLFDTAGIRETDDEIERRGVENAKSLSESADVIFYLIDAKKGMDDDDRNFMMQQKIPVVAVLNKCDEKSEIPQEEKKFWNPTILVSAKNSAGLDELVSEAKKIILCGREPSAEKIGLGSFRQKKSVEESLERIEHALKISRSGELGLDAVVQDLEDALDSLGEVTGEVSPDDVLENVFSRFCVGK